MPTQSTAYAIAILNDFISQCGGAQGAILLLKYGSLAKDTDRRAALGHLKERLLSVQNSVREILEELE